MPIRHAVARFAAAAAAAAVLMTPALAAPGTVTTAGAALNVRSAADAASSVVAQLPNGTQVDVTGVTGNHWYQVQVDGIQGYVSGDFMAVAEGETVAPVPEIGTAAVLTLPEYVKVTSGPLNIRSGAGTDTPVVGSLAAGQVVKVAEALEGWYRIDSGYISAAYAAPCDAAEAEAAQARAATLAGKGVEVAALAQKFVGYPYVAGGSSPSGFDCSGFTSYLYRQYGVILSRTPAGQLTAGTAVSVANLQPGDILVFNFGSSSGASHVGLYIGGGNFVHASTPKNGVKINSVSSPYYAGSLVGCRRIFN